MPPNLKLRPKLKCSRSLALPEVCLLCLFKRYVNGFFSLTRGSDTIYKLHDMRSAMIVGGVVGVVLSILYGPDAVLDVFRVILCGILTWLFARL